MALSDVVKRLEIEPTDTGMVPILKTLAPSSFFVNMMPEDRTPFGYVAVGSMEIAKLIAYGTFVYGLIEAVIR